MCGIAGIYNLNGGHVAKNDLLKFGATITHRGPDNFGFFISQNLGMAHNRLSLLDLSDTANQPFQNDDYVLIYNGEIYNFRSLRKRLEVEKGIVFKTTSDTEVLFYLLIENGVEAALKQIKGMFAFAFYDKRRDGLWLSRDRLGIKPLYYTVKNGTFYWASEMKTLVNNLGLKLNPVRGLFSLNGLGEKSKSKTLFDELFSVEPGTYLRLKTTEELKIFNFYNPSDDFDLGYYKELEKLDKPAIVSEFGRLFDKSVEQMLMSDAPTGAFVSGGVDSSLIAAVAKSKNPDLQLFTANVVGSLSEFDDAKLVSNHLNAKLFDYKFEPEMFLRDWVEFTYHYESPIVVHTNAVPFGNVAKLARERGVKAVLTGEGADELFLGYPKLLSQRYHKYALLPFTFLKKIYQAVPGLSEYLFPRADNSVLNFAGNLVSHFEAQQLVRNPEKLDFLAGRERNEQEMTLRLLNEHLVTLLHRNDRMGMMASIEARFPFLDEEIVKFGINLPAKFKIGKSRRFYNYKHPFLVDKWIVRKLAEKHLPKQIVYKKKFGFGMLGHKFMHVKSDFFRGGWVSESYGLDLKTIDYLTETQNPYFIAKLVSVEIFGRIFEGKENFDRISADVNKFVRLEVSLN